MPSGRHWALMISKITHVPFEFKSLKPKQPLPETWIGYLSKQISLGIIYLTGSYLVS